VLYKNQFGFRKNHSTVLALIEVVDNIYNKLDNHEAIVSIHILTYKRYSTQLITKSCYIKCITMASMV